MLEMLYGRVREGIQHEVQGTSSVCILQSLKNALL
jgi:hypothetical protein